MGFWKNRKLVRPHLIHSSKHCSRVFYQKALAYSVGLWLHNVYHLRIVAEIIAGGAGGGCFAWLLQAELHGHQPVVKHRECVDLCIVSTAFEQAVSCSQ